MTSDPPPRGTPVRHASDGHSVGDAARELGVHRQTIYSWINKEKAQPGTGLPVTRFGPQGGTIRIHPDDLARMRRHG